MNPFQSLPNEILDAIFLNMPPTDVWRFQQASKSCERALDPHLQTRRFALDSLMLFGCREGNHQVIRKAVSLGANVSTIRLQRHRQWESWTIFAASRHLDTVALLFDLGARLDINPNEIPDQERRKIQRERTPKFLKLCSDRGVREQFLDFQDCLDHGLVKSLPDPGAAILQYPGPFPDGDTRRISILMDLGANPTAWTEAYNPGTALSDLIEDMQYEYPAPWGLPALKLLLSKQPDLNIQCQRLTRSFLENPERFPFQSFCPISTAIRHMAYTGSTHVMDMLLHAGAKLDLPVHANLQPLLVYAEAVESPDSPGFDYLCRHGAKFEQLWHPEEPVDAGHLRPIFRLCERWERRPIILEDGKFGVVKLFIERGGIKKVAIPFIKAELRPMMGLDHGDVTLFAMIGRYHFLLKLVLQDGNLNPDLPQEIDDLLLDIVWEATVETTE